MRPVGVINAALFTGRPCQPDRRISDRRSHFKYSFGADYPGILLENAGDNRANDRYGAVVGLLLNFRQHFIARGQYVLHVEFNGVVGYSIHPRIFLCLSFVPRGRETASRIWSTLRFPADLTPGWFLKLDCPMPPCQLARSGYIELT